jgi:ABC-2 type transport system ATP-binding protein
MDRWRVSLFGERLHVITDDDVERAGRAVAGTLAAEGLHIRQIREARFSLEDVFIRVVEEARLRGTVAAEG